MGQSLFTAAFAAASVAWSPWMPTIVTGDPAQVQENLLLLGLLGVV
jgi:hypothetical protein